MARTSQEIEEPGSQQRLADLEHIERFLLSLHQEADDHSTVWDPSETNRDLPEQFNWHLLLNFTDSTRRGDFCGQSPRQQCAAQIQTMLAKTLLQVLKLCPNDHFADQAFLACISSWATGRQDRIDRLIDIAGRKMHASLMDGPQPF